MQAILCYNFPVPATLKKCSHGPILEISRAGTKIMSIMYLISSAALLVLIVGHDSASFSLFS